MKKLILPFFTFLSKSLSGKGIFKYRFVRFVYHKTKHFLKPDFVEIFKNKIYLDPKDSMNLSVIGANYEKNTTDYFLKNIKEGDIVVDIGANIGFFTLLFSKLVGNSGKVYSFEPELTNFHLLKKNIEINNCKNVKLINKAVSNKTGKLLLNLSEKGCGMHYLTDIQKEKNTIQVDVITLDDFFKNLKNEVDFIKIDAEGSELNAIKGMNMILENNLKIKLIVEFNLEILKRSQIYPKDFLLYLESKNLDLFDLDNNSFISSRVLTERLDSLSNGTNLVCNKHQKLS